MLTLAWKFLQFILMIWHSENHSWYQRKADSTILRLRWDFVQGWGNSKSACRFLYLITKKEKWGHLYLNNNGKNHSLLLLTEKSRANIYLGAIFMCQKCTVFQRKAFLDLSNITTNFKEKEEIVCNKINQCRTLL